MKFNLKCSWIQLQFLLQKTACSNFRRSLYTTKIITSDGTHAADQSKKKSIENYFIDPKVQSILVKITGLDYDKIFSPARQKLSTPHYEFATEERLKELHAIAQEKAKQKLQMPPVMEVRKPIDEVMAYDPEIQGFMTTNLVFIDISANVPERERFITVREPDGTLRKANWDERFRMNQIYFPIPGRKLIVPKFFESPHLDRLLEEGSYIFILDSACAQFEPDDPEYHRVTHTTFNHINSKKKFDELRSTRHFGPMAFYFAWKQEIEGLLLDMIERDLIRDAADLVKLLHILNDQPIEDGSKTNEELVSEFITQNTSVYKPHLEMALQTYKEIHENAEKDALTETNVSA